MRSLGIGVVVAALLSGAAWAELAPPDPFAPGAASQAAAAETKAAEAKPAEAKPPPHPRAAPKRAARKRAAPGGLTVTIANRRSVGLVELDVAPAGSKLKKVQGPLGFGRKAVVRLSRAKDCLYDLKAHFADEADADHSGIDLCKDRTINLIDE